MQIMSGLFWDLGETSGTSAVRRQRKRSMV
jgi:hypothetical protein